MDSAVKQFLIYLRAVRNASPHTIRSYDSDLGQFLTFLTPPGTVLPPPQDVTHLMIREFVAHLHGLKLEKSSIARKLAQRGFQLGPHLLQTRTGPGPEARQ